MNNEYAHPWGPHAPNWHHRLRHEDRTKNMMEKVQFRPHPNDPSKITIAGYDMPPAEVWTGDVHEGTRVITLKVPGHNYWSAIGQTSYAGAEFLVFERIDEGPWYRRVAEVPLRKTS